MCVGVSVSLCLSLSPVLGDSTWYMRMCATIYLHVWHATFVCVDAVSPSVEGNCVAMFATQHMQMNHRTANPRVKKLAARISVSIHIFPAKFLQSRTILILYRHTCQTICNTLQHTATHCNTHCPQRMATATLARPPYVSVCFESRFEMDMKPLRAKTDLGVVHGYNIRVLCFQCVGGVMCILSGLNMTNLSVSRTLLSAYCEFWWRALSVPESTWLICLYHLTNL